MKKFSPGCLCCGGDCEDSCFFPCTGGDDAIDCSVCGIDIQLPTPDTTGLDPLVIPNLGCPDEAPCFACYEWFDRLFNFYYYVGDPDSPPPGGICNDWSYTWLIDFLGYDIYYDEDDTTKIIRIDPCWTSRSYNCPYENNLDLYACDSSNVALSTPWVTKGTQANITLSGNEWDGTCGKLTIVIHYAAVEWQIGQSTIPIGDPEECVDPKWTEFVHTFELEYCTCSELFNAFTYVSTTTTDSCAGAVDDPCNFAGATVTLKQRPDRTAYCNVCNCLNCPGIRSDQVAITISGPVINGTFILDSGFAFGAPPGGCQYIYSIPIEACPQLKNLQVTLQCLVCDLFRAFLSIQHAYNYTMWAGKTDHFGCDDTPTFSEIEFNNGTPPCQLDGHTFQLSFVST
jgi:hypothetical protein